MKHFEHGAIVILTVLTMAGSPLPLAAADSNEVPWNQVCQVAQGRELLVTTTNGAPVAGYCVRIDVKAITVETNDHRYVKIARDTLTRIEMRRAKGHQLSSLGKGMRQGFHFGFDSLLSPLAPLGIVVVPATVAWGAVAAPFCLLGDLRYKLSGRQEIRIN